MKLSDLPPGLKELAEFRRVEYPYYRGDFHLYLCFIFKETPEGFEFWNKIDDGNFTPFYNCKVINLQLKEK